MKNPVTVTGTKRPKKCGAERNLNHNTALETARQKKDFVRNAYYN